MCVCPRNGRERERERGREREREREGKRERERGGRKRQREILQPRTWSEKAYTRRRITVSLHFSKFCACNNSATRDIALQFSSEETVGIPIF